MGASRRCWVKIIRGEEVWVAMNEVTLDDAEADAKSHRDVMHVLESQWDDPPSDGLDIVDL